MKNFWQKWTMVQKIITGAIVLVVFVAIILLATMSSSSDTVHLLSTPITDTELLDRISARLDEEGIVHQLGESGMVTIADERTARRARTLLFRENLIPKDTSPWDVFNTGSKWTITELQDEVKVQQAVTKTLVTHIKSLDEVDDAQVILTFPEERILSSSQNPVKASVIITPRPGVNMQEHLRIKGIENLVLFAVDGLEKENLTITDNMGNTLNSDDELIGQMTTLQIGKEQLKIKMDYQRDYAQKIFESLDQIYPKRVKIFNFELDLNFDVESYEENQILPTVLRKDNPLTAKDELVYVEKVDVITEKKRVIYAGTGIHPDGPAGVEGQVPDGFKENVGAIVETDEMHDIVKADTSNLKITGNKAPIHIEKISCGIVVDGRWKKVRDANGNYIESEEGGIQREFIPVSDEEIKTIERVIKSALGFDLIDGDQVTVDSIPFDRSADHEAEDASYRRGKNIRLGILITVLSIIVIIFLAVMAQMIVRAREQKRKREDQERARRLARERAEALRIIEEEGSGMLNIGGKNNEEEEMIKQLVRDNPENVAHLISTWLVEE